MKTAVRASFLIAIGALTCCLAACGSGSGSGSQAGSWDAAPTLNATRTADKPAPGRTASQALSQWKQFPKANAMSAGGFQLVSRGMRGESAFELTGTGASLAKELIGPVIPVQAGRTYTFSASIDGSQITQGSTRLWVSNAAGDKMFWKAVVPSGVRGRFGFSARVPNGVSSVRFGFYTAGCLLPKGKMLVFSAPAVSLMDTHEGRS